MLKLYQQIGRYNIRQQIHKKNQTNKFAKTAVFWPGNGCFVWLDNFLLKWSTISREAWLQLKCDSTESDAAGLQILALPVVSRRKQGKAHVFLDFTLPEQVKFVCVFTQIKKSDCKRVCVKDASHIYTIGAPKSRHLGCFFTKTWKRARVSS